MDTENTEKTKGTENRSMVSLRIPDEMAFMLRVMSGEAQKNHVVGIVDENGNEIKHELSQSEILLHSLRMTLSYYYGQMKNPPPEGSIVWGIHRGKYVIQATPEFNEWAKPLRKKYKKGKSTRKKKTNGKSNKSNKASASKASASVNSS